MSINEMLNDQCLSAIFDQFKTLDERVVLANVCQRWSGILSHGLYHIENLLWTVHDLTGSRKTLPLTYPLDFTRGDVTKLFPNVRVMEVCFEKRYNRTLNIPEIQRNNLAIKGVIVCRIKAQLPLFKCFPNMEMVAFTENYFRGQDFTGVKQFYTRRDNFFTLNRSQHQLAPTLERLHFSNTVDRPEMRFKGKFPALKILEYEFVDIDHPFNGLHLMDCCDNLESAYLVHFDNRLEYVPLKNTIRNKNLRNLVLQQRDKDKTDYKLDFKRIFYKYPNLVNLAIRDSGIVSDSHVEPFLRMLDKLELIDFRGSHRVTSKAVGIVTAFNKEHNRSIKIVIGKSVKAIKSWNIGFIRTCETIAYGFDFMANCFNCRFECLPVMMIPDNLFDNSTEGNG